LYIAGRNKFSYPAQLQEAVGEDYWVENFGDSGSCVLWNGNDPYAFGSAFKKSVEFEPDIVVVMFGINDSTVANWTDLDTYKRDYDYLIHFYMMLPSKPEIRLVAPVVPSVDTTVSAKRINIMTKEINPFIAAYAADNNLIFTDPNAMLQRDSQFYYSDQIHMNAAGASLTAYLIKEVI
jgi:lysophospholipase L1-like esterase